MDDQAEEKRRAEIRELAERLPYANANPEYVGHELADLVRKLLRASTSRQPHASASAAVMMFDQLVQRVAMLSRSDLYTSFTVAIDELSPSHQRGGKRDLWTSAAEDGARYYVELSSKDSFAAARSSKAELNFRDSVRRIHAKD
ncbi:hypothetical protein [Sphingomonas crocodyli]|uniref:Uncharacterized protein n=1 Tax=Sphingomonas crocodyli TaxID=1979270 RepID=A0A437M0S0_9SPHN|nr:hypothetical protein [Sphingomonas crocodyli]RVT91287.1 hypothetical protein EOD43_17420 [Sphingomonas crocodyli]